MKKTLTLALPLLLATAPVWAESPPAQPRSPMAQMLNLTPEQENKIAAIKREYQDKIRKLVAEGEARIEAVLTPEQKKKLEELKKQRQAMMERMRKMMQQRQQQAMEHGKGQSAQ